MKKVLLLSFLFLFSLSLAFAQTKSVQKSPPLSESTPESVGMSSERLAYIDRICEEAVESDAVPGIVALVARKGKIVYHKAFGMADNPGKRSLKSDDIFRIASQSKAITSTAVMMLWEEGHFQLDDPISRYIPAFKNLKVLTGFSYRDTSFRSKPAKNEITIRHLLNHTSGLGYGVIDGDERMKMLYHKAGITDLFTTEPITIKESVEKLATLPLHHEPGEKFTYSEGLDVLGYFIEIVSGMSFADFLRTRLFDPLGMDDTWFYLPNNKAKRLVKVQRPVTGGEGWEHFPVTFYDTDYPIKGAKKFYSGGAGLSSTAKDYATFLQMYLNGGELNGVRILSRTTIDFMMSNYGSKVSWDDGSHYGLAFGVVNEKGAGRGGAGSEGTFSWGGYFNTQYFADPKEQIIGVILKQTQGTRNDKTGWQFRQLVFQAVDD